MKVSGCDSIQTYYWVVDVSNNTRLDIRFDVNTLSQYLVQPRRVHLVAAKHVMRYLKGTIDFGIYYDGNHDYRLYGYIDADSDGSASRKKKNIRWML